MFSKNPILDINQTSEHFWSRIENEYSSNRRSLSLKLEAKDLYKVDGKLSRYFCIFSRNVEVGLRLFFEKVMD